MPVRAILAVALLIALAGCGARSPEQTASPVLTATRPSTPSPTRAPEPTASPVPTAATPTVSVPDSPPEPIVMRIIDGGPEFIGFTSLEERIFHADLIVRAKLRTLRGGAQRAHSWSDEGHWIPVIVFEFEALEFLKGEGTESVLVNASYGGSGDSWESSYEMYESERDAIAAALYRISVRDEPWDEREAIVFISKDPYWGNESYGFTLAGSIQAPEYRPGSRYNRVWLPAVDDTSQTPQRFLMTAPAVFPGFGSAPWRDARESITLEELQEAIAELDASISRAEAEGIPGYKDCLVSKYDRERKNQQAIYEGGELIRHWWQHYAPPKPVRRVLVAGLPAEKAVVGEVWVYTASPIDPEFRDKYWVDGPDAHLFKLQPDADASRDEGHLRHRVVASRSLPAGSYHFQVHVQEAHFQPCGYYDELSATDYFIEVVARE